MEMAHHLNTLDTPWGVDLVLFDGEELVFGNDPRVGDDFLGSRNLRSTPSRSNNSGRRCDTWEESCSTWSEAGT